MRFFIHTCCALRETYGDLGDNETLKEWMWAFETTESVMLWRSVFRGHLPFVIVLAESIVCQKSVPRKWATLKSRP